MSYLIRNKIVLLCMLLILPEVSAQGDLIEKLSSANIDQIEVIYATDGNMVGPDNDIKYFIFGVVKLHKTGAPETEWSRPIFFFEFDGKATLASTASYHYFLEENEDGTLNHLPALRELSSHTEEFELDFVFTKTGELDVSKSSVSLVPQQYASGREITQKTWTGEYYKKGNKTERFVPIRDEEGKVINLEKRGRPVIEEMSVRVLDVCYEGIMGRGINYLRANLGNLTYYNTTGLCTVYKIQGVSRSAGIPDARALSLISTDTTKSSAPKKSESPEVKDGSFYITNKTVKPPTMESLKINRTTSNKTKPFIVPEEGNQPGVVNPVEKPPEIHVPLFPPQKKSGG